MTTGEWMTTNRIDKWLLSHKPQATKNDANMNIYERLSLLGWKRTNGNSRLDFYHKKNWICIVPSSTIGKIRFMRVSK